ncbi:MAG TPA: SMP-30/gluconolactonase/LRE family protein, partial [Flavisolibacter sp.]|nr:SMP-30/gluconolactonase/LRE family protein [Flavisolibacter sp.]
MSPTLQVYQDSVIDIIDTDYTFDVLADDCQFTEGPVWHPDGYYLFSDIPANVIYKIRPGSAKEVYLKNSGTDDPLDPDLKPDQTGSNALAYDPEGRLLICQHGSHAIARYDGQQLKPYIDRYEGRPFNSP